MSTSDYTLPLGPFTVHAVGATDVGREREVNEDALFVDPNHQVFLVCDGMGGHSAGQVASNIVVKSIEETFAGAGRESATAREGSSGEPLEDEPLIWALKSANRAVFEHAQQNPDCRGMGTTGVAMRIDADKQVAHVCHVGDSRLYRRRGNSLALLTRDHSLQNLYADKPNLAGRLGPATSNVIVRALGLEKTVEVAHRVIALEQDDLFLLCSDGLSDMVSDDFIAEVLQSDAPLEAMAGELIATANDNGGTDNITVLLVGILHKGGGFHDIQKTALGY